MILVIIMALPATPIVAQAATPEMTIRASEITALAGSEVQIQLTLENNPGLAAMKVKVAFDDILTLTDVVFNDAMGGHYQMPQTYTSPVSLTWYNGSANFTDSSAVFATLTFTVAEDAAAGEVARLKITHNPSDVYNIAETDIPLTAIDGSVTVMVCVPGDINGDEVTNLKDLTRLFQYLADWDVEVNDPALDTNGDGSVNLKDLTRLFQYLADWDVELYPKVSDYIGPTDCAHELTAVDYKAATCTDEGNIAFWSCDKCGKYFSDAAGVKEIAESATVIASLPHTEVAYSKPGCMDGIKCSVCGKVIEEPKPTGTNVREIEYEIANGNSYIKKMVEQNKVTNPNPQYVSSMEAYPVKNLDIDGFYFLGWYDLAKGDAAVNIKQLLPGDGVTKLYAHWEPIEYEIQYKSDSIPIEIPTEYQTYTVDKEEVLYTPELTGYTFVGWSDDNGNVIRKLPVGSTGHKTYTANWLSDRNQAWAKRKLEDPIIYENDNVILFAYEIGDVRNVPLYEVHDFGKILSDGVTKTETKRYSATTSVEQMEAYTTAIAKATTESFSWTLAEGWSDSISVDSEWLEENEMTEQEAKEICTNESENWYTSSGSSGTDTTVELDSTDTYDLTTTTSNTKTYNTKDKETRQDFSAGLNAEISTKRELSAGLDLGGGLNIGAKSEVSASIGADVKYANGVTTNTKTGTEEDDGEDNQDGTIKRASTETTNTSSWNTESGTGGSKSVSESTAVMQELSKRISQKTGYGKSYIQTGDQSETQGSTSTSSSEEEYTSSVTFTKIVEESVEKTFTTENTKSGFHRWVIAGTAHVFGVVGYDIASESYFSYSFSIMDDRTFEYEDYSYNSSNYDDNQSSIIPFEAPDDIVEHVLDRISGSEGLEVSRAGIITAYNGDDAYVTIPEYISLDGTAIKVTGISETAFQNKDMEAIQLSDFITAIPDNAFKGCTSLLSVEGKNLTSIGSNAFEGCTELKYFTLGRSISYLGEDVFNDVEMLTVYTSDADIVEAAVNSGAKQIAIYVEDPDEGFEGMELVLPETTEAFLFDGDGETFEDLYIISEARRTLIANAVFESSSKTPLDLSSEEVVLQEIEAYAPGIALVCRAEHTNISLYGESTLYSETENAMLCKTLSLEQHRAGLYSHLTANGNLLIYNIGIEGVGYLQVNGSIVTITEEQFENYAIGVYTVTFVANGGSLDGSASLTKTMVFGSAYGTLPTPTRNYYTFNGWYTAKTGGTAVTADTVFKSTEPITLYARWTENALSSWVDEDDMPADAEVVNTRYQYTLTEFTTSDKASMSGWEKYDTSWVWGEYGAWSDWSTTEAVKSDSRKVEKETRIKWVDTSHYQHKYHYYHFCCSCGELWLYTTSGIAHNGVSGSHSTGHEIWVDEELPFYRNSGGMNYYAGPSCSSGNSCYWFKADGTSNGNYKTFEKDVWVEEGHNEEYFVWRYADRSKIYTYYFKKVTNNKTSEAYPTAGTDQEISNIVKQVQYRAK